MFLFVFAFCASVFFYFLFCFCMFVMLKIPGSGDVNSKGLLMDTPKGGRPDPHIPVVRANQSYDALDVSGAISTGPAFFHGLPLAICQVWGSTSKMFWRNLFWPVEPPSGAIFGAEDAEHFSFSPPTSQGSVNDLDGNGWGWMSSIPRRAVGTNGRQGSPTPSRMSQTSQGLSSPAPSQGPSPQPSPRCGGDVFGEAWTIESSRGCFWVEGVFLLGWWVEGARLVFFTRK